MHGQAQAGHPYLLFIWQSNKALCENYRVIWPSARLGFVRPLSHSATVSRALFRRIKILRFKFFLLFD
jgi:hypothetical protein